MQKNYKYYTLITALFVTILLTSNITSTKIVSLWWLTFDGGTILFPLSYIFWDILTEVYGYKKSRQVIWTGFLWALIMTLSIIAVGLMPAASFWTFQEAYSNILMYAPRIVFASLIAYIAWEFTNSYVIAKMKIKMQWKMLPLRTIVSTLLWQWIDTSIFIIIAFYWIFTTNELIALFLSNYVLKVWIEILFTPITIFTVTKLKKIESEDYYDTKTDFNPLKVFS